MYNFTISVEVNFGEATLNLLQNFLQTPRTPEMPPRVSARPEPEFNPPRIAVSRGLETKQTPAPAPAPAPVQEESDDLPVSDEELRAAVKAAKDRTSASDVKGIFAEFGIRTSIECPDSKRASLLDRLNELAGR